MADDRRPPAAGRARWRLAGGLAAVVASGLITSACAAGSGSASVGPARAPTAPAAHSTAAPSPLSAAAATPPGAAARPKPLAGKIVGIDPGHNGRNFADPAYLNHLIWNGRQWETCDTTGTQTAGGYTEARYNFEVARYLRADLQRQGAAVVLTRTSNQGVGPCVNRRARILDAAHAGVAIDIHADGGPPPGRGFTILEPVADGPNDHVIGASDRFGSYLRHALLAGTPMPISNYDGQNGFMPRDDLAGLNLTTMPKVLIECGNMRNATDARMLTSARFQKRIAAALDAAITRFLTGRS